MALPVEDLDLFEAIDATLILALRARAFRSPAW
jgi:hypothetical protein